MKHYKKKQVELNLLDSTSCDLCQHPILRRGGREIDESVEIRQDTGESYPEGRFGEFTRLDICGPCFTNRLLPWLESQGATPQTGVLE